MRNPGPTQKSKAEQEPRPSTPAREASEENPVEIPAYLQFSLQPRALAETVAAANDVITGFLSNFRDTGAELLTHTPGPEPEQQENDGQQARNETAPLPGNPATAAQVPGKGADATGQTGNAETPGNTPPPPAADTPPDAIAAEGTSTEAKAPIAENTPPAEEQPAVSSGGGAPAGGGASMAAFRSQVQERAEAIPEPAAPENPGSGVRETAQQRREEIHFTESGVADQAKAQLPPTPENVEVPAEPTQDDPVPEATRQLEATAGQQLPTQTFVALQQTPFGNTPSLGARPLSAERIREAHRVLEEGPQMSFPDDPREPLMRVRDSMLNPPPVPDAQNGATTLPPRQPAPVPTPTPTARTQLAEVFARLLARPDEEARQMVSRARQAAFPGGTLDTELPNYGDDPHIANLTRDLTTQYRDIATQAGVAAEDLDQAVAARQRTLQEQEAVSRQELATTSSEATAEVCQAHDELASTISTEAGRIDATADAVTANAGGGSYAAQVHARRDGLLRRVTTRAAEIDAAYRRARTDRDRELDTAQSQRVDAYRAAAQIDEFQLNEIPSLPPARQAAFRARYTEETGAAPAQESGLNQVEINTLAAVSSRWSDARAVDVRTQVTSYKNTVRDDTESWRGATLLAADSARQQIRAWDEAESGETRSWWDRFWDWVHDWSAQAHANAEAWQAQQNQQHATQVVTDLNLLDRLNRAAEQGITEDQERELRSLTGEQAQIVQAFFQARREGRAVDPIEMVADLTRARIWNERRPDVVKALEDQFLADESLSYAQIGRVVGTEVSGLCSKLYAAFHGNWGLLSEAGTDEAAVFAALNGLNRVQSLALRNVYRRRYGVDLDSELRSELSGGELDRAQALLSGNRAEAAAATLYSAMHETFLGTGLGTDEAAIHETLRGLNAEERAEVRRIYRERYGRDLATDTRAELDDWATTSDREADRADAELAGNLELADAIEIEEETQGSWFHSSTTTTVAGVYERVRREVQAQAQREGRDSAWMEAEITRRSQGIERSYNTRNEGTGATLQSDIRAATQAEAAFWGNTPENRDASRDYLQALSQNNMAAADAARIRIERTALVYADDKVITSTLGSQYDRALTAQRLDYAPDRRRALMAALDKEEQASRTVWTAAQRWERQQAIERQIERELIQRARAVADRNLANMEGEYAARYGESARTAVLESTSGVDNEMARAQLDQGGYLDPYQTFDFATRGAGTNEEAAKRAFAGLTRDEIAAYDARWRREHNGESLLEAARSDLSGRDLLDVEIALDGTPETIDQQIAQMRRRVEFERPTNPIGEAFNASVAGTERQVMEEQLAALEAMAVRMKAPPQGSTPAEQQRARDALLGQFETQNALVTQAIEHHRERSDAMVDSITTAVGIVVAVVVGVVGSFFTGGAAGAVALAIIASLASTAATIGTRALLKGNAYGWEDFAVDVGVGLVDAVVAALTAGLGDKLLRVAAPAGQAAVRTATATGLRGAWQRVVLRLGEEGLLTRAIRPVGFLGRMANAEARQGAGLAARGLAALSKGAATVMAETTENFVQSLPSTMLGVALDDNTWSGPGNPLLNLLSGTAQGLGQGMAMGLAMGPVMKHVQGGFGRLHGLVTGPHLGADTHLRMPERPLPGSPDYHARMTDWQQTHPGRPEAEFQAHVDSEFEKATRAYEAQQQTRREVAGHLEEALPPADRTIAAEVPVTVVSDLEFRSLNGWRGGDATVVVRDGQVHIVVRDGAPPHAVRAQLEAQVQRLRNLVEPGTGGRVRDPRAALPRDIRGRIPVEIDPDLPPRTVRVEHTPVPRIIAGPGARAADIRLHVQTARNVLQLHGAFGRVRHLLDRMADWVFLHGEPPVGTRAWEAQQEIRKLPDIIKARQEEATRPDLSSHERAAIEADVAHLRQQLEAHARTVADLDVNPGRGFIAAEGRAVPPLAELDAAHQRWVDQMRSFIRGEGPPPLPWTGPEPQLDGKGTWRGHDPAEAYAAFRKALKSTNETYEANISRDRNTGEYLVMIGKPATVAPPADTLGRHWDTVLHFHPNAENGIRYTLPAPRDIEIAMMRRARLGSNPPPHVEFVESVFNGERTRVAIVLDQKGSRLEIGRGAAGQHGPVTKGETLPVPWLDRYQNEYWKPQHPGSPRPTLPEGEKVVVHEDSQEYRRMVHKAAEDYAHPDVQEQIRKGAPELEGVPSAHYSEAETVVPHTADAPAEAALPTAPHPATSASSGPSSARTPANLPPNNKAANGHQGKKPNPANRPSPHASAAHATAPVPQPAAPPRKPHGPARPLGEARVMTHEGRQAHLHSAEQRLDAAQARLKEARQRIDDTMARLKERARIASENYATAPEETRAAADIERRQAANELKRARRFATEETRLARQELADARAEAEAARQSLSHMRELNADLDRLIAQQDAILRENRWQTPPTSTKAGQEYLRLQTDIEAHRGSLRDHIIRTEGLATWMTHEAAVVSALNERHPGRVGAQVKLEVTLEDGTRVVIKPDALVETGPNTYRIVDAKFSETAAISEKGDRPHYTENQEQAYPRIAAGQITSARVYDESGAKLGLSTNDRIDLEKRIEIHTNKRNGDIEVRPYRR